jgi:hypothetical protein
VRGTLPSDLTDAVYDLPGYEGHTAFVEGFQMDVALTADGASAGTLAVADTGASTTGLIIVNKVCDADSEPAPDGEFNISIDSELSDYGPIQVGCGEPARFEDIDFGTYAVLEQVLEGPYERLDGSCTTGLEITSESPEADCDLINEEVVEEETGSITIIKDTNPETNNIFFDFDSDFGDFDLEDDDPITFDDLADTTYSFEENPPAGWEVVDIICDADDYNTDIPDGGLVVDLQEGEDVTCTFVNEEIDENGTIIIEKDVDPEPDGTDFSFSDNITSCVIGVLDDDGGGATPNSVTCTDVPAGDYEVTENVPAGYELFHIDCDDADGNTSVGSATAFIDLDDGETVHCVFHNRPVQPVGSSITIFKDTNPETINVVFDFDSPQFGDFDLFDNGAKTFTNLGSGAYTVSENPPSGWALLDIVCDSSGVVESGNSVIIQLGSSQHVTCSFVNVQTAAPAAPTPTKPPAPVATQVPIAAPSAGDGGLADPDSGGGVRWVVVVLTGVVGAATVAGYVRMLSRRA